MPIVGGSTPLALGPHTKDVSDGQGQRHARTRFTVLRPATREEYFAFLKSEGCDRAGGLSRSTAMKLRSISEGTPDGSGGSRQ